MDHNYGRITTGLSIALIVLLALLIYTALQKGKLHKENMKLHDRIKEIENRNS